MLPFLIVHPVFLSFPRPMTNLAARMSAVAVFATATLMGCKECPPAPPTRSAFEDSVAQVNYDLYIEQYSRSSHLLYVEATPVAPVLYAEGLNNSPVPVEHPAPVLEPPDVPGPTSQDLVFADMPGDRARRQRDTVTITNTDVGRVGLERWLREVGFNVRTIAGRSGQVATNTIVVGDSVDLGDLQAVALKSSALGLPIRRIRSFSRSTRPFEIELRAIPYAADNSALSVAEIRALRRSPP